MKRLKATPMTVELWNELSIHPWLIEPAEPTERPSETKRQPVLVHVDAASLDFTDFLDAHPETPHRFFHRACLPLLAGQTGVFHIVNPHRIPPNLRETFRESLKNLPSGWVAHVLVTEEGAP